MQIEDIENLLVTAKQNPEEFFKKYELKELQKLCHPDRHTDKDKAHRLFTEFTTLSTPVKLGYKDYTLFGSPIVGDTSDVYIGKEVIKICRLGIPFAENERRVLATLKGHYFPEVIDSCKQINIFKCTEGTLRLSEVSNVNDRHVAWIYKRLLSAIGFAHHAGLTHGGITPDNVLITPLDHGLLLIDWKFGGKNEVKKSKKWLKMYPKDTKVSKETDIYMATMLVLSLGIVPRQMHTFMQSCLLEKPSMRPNDAFCLYDEFSDLCLKLYGKPKFVEWK